jgi:soluble lytic murein transglycosylase-like protein
MVRHRLALAAAIAVMTGAPAAAQTMIDWRSAGGDLFAIPSPTPSAPEVGPPETVRLASLDQPFADAIAEAADRHGLDRKLLHALVVVESAYRAQACSTAGACGLTQLMPGTAADLGVRDRLDPYDNLRGGPTIWRVRFFASATSAWPSRPIMQVRIGSPGWVGFRRSPKRRTTSSR